MCISPDGRLVAVGFDGGVVRLWDVQTGQMLESFAGHHDVVFSVAFTHDGEGLISGAFDTTVKYWDLRQILATRGGSRLSGPGTPPDWSRENGSDGISKDKGSKESLCRKVYLGHRDFVLSVAVSHDNRWVVSGAKDRGVLFWDTNTAIPRCLLQGHKDSGKSYIYILVVKAV